MPAPCPLFGITDAYLCLPTLAVCWTWVVGMEKLVVIFFAVGRQEDSWTVDRQTGQFWFVLLRGASRGPSPHYALMLGYSSHHPPCTPPHSTSAHLVPLNLLPTHVIPHATYSVPPSFHLQHMFGHNRRRPSAFLSPSSPCPTLSIFLPKRTWLPPPLIPFSTIPLCTFI